MKVFRGRLVHSVDPHQAIQVLEDRLIGVQGQTGKIIFIDCASHLDQLAGEHGFDKNSVILLTDSQFLMPGMVDTHIHAPQYVNSGTGYNLMLLDWLKTYTFPTEARFKDLTFAKDVYTKAVKRTLLHGTTTASYFATIHLEASKELCRVIEKLGQRALIGKVNMDSESPEYYVEDTAKSIQETRSFIEFVKEMENPLIDPVITPRFAPSCSAHLLHSLGALAEEYDVHVQSHMCEQVPEVEYTLQLFPEHNTTAEIFESAKLMTSKTIMAHCIHTEDSETDMFEKYGVGVAHCPNSNFNLCSGILNARSLLDRGIKIGLGTDVSGGHSPSILNVLRSCIMASRAHSFWGNGSKDNQIITHHHAFYMATLGGAKVLSLEDKIGNFMVGKEFDALLIDTQAPSPESPVFDVFEDNSFDNILMKFLYLGDDRNILKRYVSGEEITDLYP